MELVYTSSFPLHRYLALVCHRLLTWGLFVNVCCCDMLHLAKCQGFGAVHLTRFCVGHDGLHVRHKVPSHVNFNIATGLAQTLLWLECCSFASGRPFCFENHAASGAQSSDNGPFDVYPSHHHLQQSPVPPCYVSEFAINTSKMTNKQTMSAHWL